MAIIMAMGQEPTDSHGSTSQQSTLAQVRQGWPTAARKSWIFIPIDNPYKYILLETLPIKFDWSSCWLATSQQEIRATEGEP